MDLIDAKTFGMTIKTQRKKLNISQLHLAAIADTGVRFISDLENGKPSVYLEKALQVAKILGLKIEISGGQGNINEP